MTALEMQRSFLVLYDKITNFSAPGYTEEEISLFLTKAQERLVLYYYKPMGNKYNEGFEETEQRRKELSSLLEGNTNVPVSISQVGVLPNGKFFDYPTNLLYTASEEVTIASSDACINGKRIEVKPITYDEYTINKRNPYKKPFADSDRGLVWRVDYNTRRHELITDSTFTISNYHIRYIKKPQPIIIDTSILNGITGPLDCTLNDILHERIIDEAVKIATGITDPLSYQIKSVEKQAGE